jgi:ferredoxin--NADP+ reductase
MCLPEEIELDDLSRAALDHNPDQATIRKLEILQEYASRNPTGKPRRLVIRFLVSPVELIGNEAGQMVGMRLVRNTLYATEAGTLRPRQTDEFEELPVSLMFRSVGYRGVPLPGVPFNDKWGVIVNQKGRVVNPDTQQPVVGEYTAGWIKRGPSGVVGTNKPDAAETVACMLEDLAAGSFLKPVHPEATAAENMVRERQPDYFTYMDWLRLDEMEVAKGRKVGRPRVKFTSVADMLAALGR